MDRGCNRQKGSWSLAFFRTWRSNLPVLPTRTRKFSGIQSVRQIRSELTGKACNRCFKCRLDLPLFEGRCGLRLAPFARASGSPNSARFGCGVEVVAPPFIAGPGTPEDPGGAPQRLSQVSSDVRALTRHDGGYPDANRDPAAPQASARRAAPRSATHRGSRGKFAGAHPGSPRGIRPSALQRFRGNSRRRRCRFDRSVFDQGRNGPFLKTVMF